MKHPSVVYFLNSNTKHCVFLYPPLQNDLPANNDGCAKSFQWRRDERHRESSREPQYRSVSRSWQSTTTARGWTWWRVWLDMRHMPVDDYSEHMGSQRCKFTFLNQKVYLTSCCYKQSTNMFNYRLSASTSLTTSQQMPSLARRKSPTPSLAAYLSPKSSS